MTDSTRFHGIYPSIICPLRADYSVDETALAKHVAELCKVSGVVGILCNGHAGENAWLERVDLRRVLAVTREAAGGKLVVAGINHESSLAAAELARDAETERADAVMVFAPYSWALGQDEQMAVAHHRLVRDATGLPMMLFQGSVRSGRIAYTASVLAELARLPDVVGIKEGSWETAAYEATRRILAEAAPHVAVMASGDEHLLTCFVLGSEGSLVSLAVLIPELIVALDRAVRRNDLIGAQQAHRVIQPLANAIYGTPPGVYAAARLKTCLKVLGRLPNDLMRPPLGALGLDEVARLEQALSAAGLR
jgi:4-hydroxy-tetrahydrodipicolinate synthase